MPNLSPQIKSIFAAALEFDSQQERSSYLHGACGENSELRREIESLLAAHSDANNFLSRAIPQVEPIEISPAAASPGTQIGPYKIREQIGEGGMGEVYVAEQERPVRRKVALKIIRPGMATRDVIARFEAERQALALMDHPNIAKVFDAGTVGGVRSAECGVRSEEEESINSELRTPNSALENTPNSELGIPHSGPPYFVMELVQGPPITEYCDACRLTTHERLILFLSVCRAVQHAHQKGIIHRDLKPSNVLVPEIDGAPVPKVIDFGVAKAIDQKLTEQTVYTQFSQMIGTPMYMSPEQAGLGVVDVDTRSDIYSLGVLLYELLTGTTPFDAETLKKASFEEMQRIIREQDPPPPSKRLTQRTKGNDAHTTQSATRHPQSESPDHSAFRTPNSAFDRDLDWIVMKCLEKDRTRRYQSVSDLAQDIERHLANEPVAARPPSAAYCAKKFIRRHRVGAAVAAAVLLTAALGAVLSGVGFSRAVRERNIARQHLLLGCQLIDDAMEPAFWMMAHAPHSREVLEALCNNALDFYETLDEHAANDPTARNGLARTLLRLAWVRFLVGGDAASLARRAVAVASALVAEHPGAPRYLYTLGFAHDSLAREYRRDGRWRDARREEEQAIAAARSALQQDPSDLESRRLYLEFVSNYANSLAHTGELERAKVQFESAVRLADESQSAGKSFYYPRIFVRRSFAELLMDDGRYDEAVGHLEEARRLALFAIDEALNDQNRSDANLFEYWLGEVARGTALLDIRRGDASKAQRELPAAIARFALAAAGHESVWTAHQMGYLHHYRATALEALGQFELAIASHHSAIDAWSQTKLSHDACKVGDSHWRIGEVLFRQDKPQEASQHFASALKRFEDFRRALPDDELTANDRLIVFLSNCPDAAFRDPDRAIALCEKVRTDSNGPLWLYQGLAQYRAGRFAEAMDSIERSIQLRTGGDALDRFLLAALHYQMGNGGRAREEFQQAETAISDNRPIYYGHIGVLGFQRIREEVRQLLK
jgi:serine/threonine protein kinase/tetratricopeptide (TPR) repeat protein